MSEQVLTVDLGNRSYPIVIGRGLFRNRFDLKTFLPSNNCLVVTNETVGSLYLESLRACLPGSKVRSITLADGEKYKTLSTARSVIDELVAAKADRQTSVIALGGGVIGDIAGFAAACYMRGVPFVQIPTTLLAQVDSSVGGKTGVNHPAGKNLIGAFHQPKIVLIETETLSTLPDREFRAGLAEVIKYGAIIDIEFFVWLEEHIKTLLERDPEALTYAIRRSCEIKAGVVAQDECEAGKRALLNFGHTFGHAIEKSAGYGEWLHGEAVAAGMVMAASMSEIPEDELDRLSALIGAAGLPVTPPCVGADKLKAAMRTDKKIQLNMLRLVLLRALGSAFVTSEYSQDRLLEVVSRADG